MRLFLLREDEMDYKKYEELLNRVMKKCPLESGVQTLVFMYLDELFENCSKYEPVIIDKLPKASSFNTKGGISDIALVGNDFNYEESKKDEYIIDKAKIRFCIEIKKTTTNITGYKTRIQFLGHLLTFGEGIITNGYQWEYCKLDLEDKDRSKVEEKVKEYIAIDNTNDDNDIKKNRKKNLADEILGENGIECVKTMFDNPEKTFNVATYHKKSTKEDKVTPAKFEVNVNEFLRLTDHINGLIQELNV